MYIHTFMQLFIYTRARTCTHIYNCVYVSIAETTPLK